VLRPPPPKGKNGFALCDFHRHTLRRGARPSCIVPANFAQNRALLAEVHGKCGLPDQVNDAIASRIGCWFCRIDLVGLAGHSILDDEAADLDTSAYATKDLNPLARRLPLLRKSRICQQENGEQGSPIPHGIPL
jgi:hypothetical protein